MPDKPTQEDLKESALQLAPGPFRQRAWTDDVDISCPCGKMTSGEGDIIGNFRRAHRSHTNGYLEDFEPGVGYRYRKLDQPFDF